MPPETAKLRAAKIELERCIVPAPAKHVMMCVAKLAVLPTKDGSPVDKALYTDNFIDACGEFPEDLWTKSCIELLKTAKWRPNPSDFIAVAQKQLDLRERMLFRVKQMLTFTPRVTTGGVKEPLEVRLRTIRDAWKRIGNLARSDIAERELALLEGREPQQSCGKVSTEDPQPVGEAIVVEESAGLRRIGEATARVADSAGQAFENSLNPESQARLKMALAREHRKDGRIGYAKTLEAAALKLWPALAEGKAA